jgi:hypothetical protein
VHPNDIYLILVFYLSIINYCQVVFGLLQKHWTSEAAQVNVTCTVQRLVVVIVIISLSPG